MFCNSCYERGRLGSACRPNIALTHIRCRVIAEVGWSVKAADHQTMAFHCVYSVNGLKWRIHFTYTWCKKFTLLFCSRFFVFLINLSSKQADFYITGEIFLKVCKVKHNMITLLTVSLKMKLMDYMQIVQKYVVTVGAYSSTVLKTLWAKGETWLRDVNVS
jgi:hypothetical protein